MNAVKYIALTLMLAVFSGCVTYPIDKNIQQEAKPLTLDQVKANLEGARGTIVIWGGQIINLDNKTNGSAIHIMQFPLSGGGKPNPYGPTMGQFIALTNGFLDPNVLAPGHLITVAGVVAGVQMVQIQNTLYPCPVLAIQQTHLWLGEPADRYYNDYDDYYGWPGWYWGPWYWGAGWWGYSGYYYPHHYYGGYHGGHGRFGGHGWHGGGGGFHR